MATKDTAGSTVYGIEDLIDHESGWDWENKHVSDSYIDSTGASKQTLDANDIIEAGTVLICAGPADLNAAVKNSGNASTGKGDAYTTNYGSINLTPIGLVESAQISMNKQLNRIFEIGSKISYIINGRVMGGINLSRVFFDGPSLLKVLYRGEVKSDNANQKDKEVTFGSTGRTEKVAHIGSGNIAMNLDSNFFDKPMGLAFIFRDQSNQNVGQIYFEGCHVSTYGMGISANMNVLSESVSIEFTKVRPIVTASTTDGVSESTLTDRNIVTEQGSIRTQGSGQVTAGAGSAG